MTAKSTKAAKIGIRMIIATMMGSCMGVTPVQAESGIASVYTVRSNNGTRTASGRIFRDAELTAAHPTIQFGTKVRVTNKRNGRSVVVVITDRGPFIRGRVIDLSPAGARAIGMGYGLAPVKLEIVGCAPRLGSHALASC